MKIKPGENLIDEIFYRQKIPYLWYFNEMSIKGGITIDFVSRTVKETGRIRATVVRIVHDRKWLAKAEQFPTPTKRYCGSRKCNITDEE